MNKKDLKKFINKNGFFVNADKIEKIEGNALEELLSGEAENAIRTSAKVPKKAENIVFFRGIITQQYEPGKVNRNGYKIDINGWDWKNYKKNPQILLQHDSNKPIGKALQIIKNESNIELVYFVNLDWIDGVDKARVAEGAFPAMSTGSMVVEYMFEHKKTGVRIEKDAYYKLSWEESKEYDFVVTKSEGFENSVVAIGSNEDALTIREAIEIFFNKHAMKTSTEKTEENVTDIAEGKVKDVEKNENEEEKTEETENEGTDEGAEKTEESENDESGEDNSEETEEKTSENDESEEKAESENDTDDSEGEKSEEETETESESDDSKDEKTEDFILPKEALEAIQPIVDLNAKLVEENALKDAKINELQKILDNTPNKKVHVVSQFANNGKKDSGKQKATNGIDCLKNMGVKIV